MVVIPNLRTVALHVCALASASTCAFAWFPGPSAEMVSHGFQVDATDRADVVSFWHHVYEASADFEQRALWTGSIGADGACTPGENNAALNIDTERRINFYRALTGMHANVRIRNEVPVFTNVSYGPPLPPDTTPRGEAAMLAALSTTLAGGPNHNPSSNAPCYSPEMYNGAFLSSLALGLWGPDAIDGYMDEEDVDFQPEQPLEVQSASPEGGASLLNRAVGHRRWILFPGIRSMGAASIPEQTVGEKTYRSVNALYNFGDLEPASPREFVPFPYAGYVPEQIMPFRWSLSFPDADFSEAQVTVTDAFGKPLKVIIDERSESDAIIGDKTLAWRVFDLPTVQNPNQTISIDVDKDTKLRVEVTGIKGTNVPSFYSYEVTIIDPETLPEPLQVLGSATPTIDGANLFVSQAKGFDTATATIRHLMNANFIDGAENGSASVNLEAITPASYDAHAPDSALSDLVQQLVGGWPRFSSETDPAWNLTFQTFPGLELQESGAFTFGFADANTSSYLQIRGILRPRGEDVTLKYKWRRGWMTSSSELRVELSHDNGATWIVVPNSSVRGRPSDEFFVLAPDMEDVAVALPIPVDQTAEQVLIRFAYVFAGNPASPSILSHDYFVTDDVTNLPTRLPTGIFIDDVELTGLDRTVEIGDVPLDSSSGRLELSESVIGDVFGPNERFTVQITNAINGFEFAPTGIFEFSPTSRPIEQIQSFDEWRQNSFAVIGEADADFDDDGLPNLIEFAFGTDPLNGSDATPTAPAEGGPAPQAVEDGKFGICRVVPGLNPQLNYKAEWTDDLTATQWNEIDAIFEDGCLRASVDIGDFDGLYMRWVITPKD